MKKFFYTISIMLLCGVYCAAAAADLSEVRDNDLGEIELALNDAKPIAEPTLLEKEQPRQELFAQENIPLHSRFYDSFTKTFKDVYELQIEDTEKVSMLMADKLTWHYDRGPLEKLHIWAAHSSDMQIDFEGSKTHTKHKESVINIEFDGVFKGGKEEFKVFFDPTPQSTRPFFQPFVQDLFIQSHRIPHHLVLVGNSRTGVGYEGAGSPFTLPLINRSQISRHFGNARKFGLRVKGDYSLIDYDIGGYSSDTYFSSFFPGAEFEAWANLKPLGKTDGKYGKLTTGGGIVTGERHSVDFFVAGAYLGYQYKKFWLRSEYATADGSNGSTGLSRAKQEGWYVTLGYHLTKKLEAIARYDEYDPDRTVAHNNKREYSAGINYYIKGQALKLILNYVFCQNQSSADSHRLLIGTQVLI